MTEATKTCGRCGEEKQLDGFVKNKGGKFGRHSVCRSCQGAADRARRARLSAAADKRDVPSEKKCCSCGETKPASSFGISRDKLDGLSPSCTECKNKTSRNNHAARMVSREYRERRATRQRDYNENWLKRADNAEKMRQWRRAWIADNPDAKERYRLQQSERYHSDEAYRSEQVERARIQRLDPAYKAEKLRREKERRDTDPEYRARYYEYQRQWREKRRDDEHFDDFMRRMEIEEAEMFAATGDAE